MRSEKPGCLKIGCLASLGFAVLALIFVVAIAYIARSQGRSSETSTSVLEPSLPSVEMAGEETALEPSAAGRIVLDLRQAEFYVEPAPPGEALRVEATMNERFAQLEEKLETEANGDWVYRVTFRHSGSALIGVVGRLLGAPQPEVRVLIPPDLPHRLEIALDQGAAEVELGGLWLTGLKVEMSKGGMVLEISEPLREPIDEIVLEGEMGGLVASSLGNASPARLRVDYRMGGVVLDLQGAWRRDGHVDVAVAMGGGNVILPDNVTVRGVPTTRPPVVSAEAPEVPLPVVTIEITGEDVEITE